MINTLKCIERKSYRSVEWVTIRGFSPANRNKYKTNAAPATQIIKCISNDRSRTRFSLLLFLSLSIWLLRTR